MSAVDDVYCKEDIDDFADAGFHFDLHYHLRKQRIWSTHTFGPGDRHKGNIDHIRKELKEIEANPTDLEEWVDVILLACDGAMRAGHSPRMVCSILDAKLRWNMQREWPNWREQPMDKAIEHVKEVEDESRD